MYYTIYSLRRLDDDNPIYIVLVNVQKQKDGKNKKNNEKKRKNKKKIGNAGKSKFTQREKEYRNSLTSRFTYLYIRSGINVLFYLSVCSSLNFW